MKNQIKKVVGMVLLVAVLFTTVGQEAQAAKQIEWPYGTYQMKGNKKVRLFWQYATEPTVKYPELIQIWDTRGGWTKEDPYRISFKQAGVNKYKTKVLYPTGKTKVVYELKSYKNSLKIREISKYGDNFSATGLLPKVGKWYTFKLKKRLSRNVG